jgi:hypothetical protein
MANDECGAIGEEAATSQSRSVSEGVKEAAGDIIQDVRCFGRDTNSTSPRYRCIVVSLH